MYMQGVGNYENFVSMLSFYTILPKMDLIEKVVLAKKSTNIL
jgi:hypothetical protein